MMTFYAKPNQVGPAEFSTEPLLAIFNRNYVPDLEAYQLLLSSGHLLFFYLQKNALRTNHFLSGDHSGLAD
jgi:hypothetical protein